MLCVQCVTKGVARRDLETSLEIMNRTGQISEEGIAMAFGELEDAGYEPYRPLSYR